LEHGAIDMIVDRREMRDKIAVLLDLLLQGGEAGKAATETPVVPRGE
ncbi:MAG: acetyl-CoA carboxylase carboxyl transferase subunit beta, partial [Candidatus Methylumidiphilus alinenensis]